jgi:uncharacterized protein (TIGR00730 family)
MAQTSLSICVFCGAKEGHNPAHAQAARDLGAAMADMGARLVYGAGDVGLMGIVARTAMAAGATCLGVIPKHLLDLEVGKRDLTEFIVTENMHERKMTMFLQSDVIALLPGGAGSLDEFFEVLTWRQIGLHRKPIFLLNTRGYWTPLMALMDHVIAQGFAEDAMRSYATLVPDVAALTLRLRDPADPARSWSVGAGGVAQLATLVGRLRAEVPNTVVVSAGDLVGASPLASALFRDEPTIEVMNALGVDLGVVGNHEFDFGSNAFSNCFYSSTYFAIHDANNEDRRSRRCPSCRAKRRRR